MNAPAIAVRPDGPVCTISLVRADRGNTLDTQLLGELERAIDRYEAASSVFVLSGAPEVFCLGADLAANSEDTTVDPDRLFALWMRLANGPFVSIAHVCGPTRGGGVGLAAACDVVVAGANAEFSLPELIFGLTPACVFPFLARRVGPHRARQMALTTLPVGVVQALDWGLVDAWGEDSMQIVRRYLMRLRRLPKEAIKGFKDFLSVHDGELAQRRELSVSTNRAMFADPRVLARLNRYARDGLFPWE